MRNGKNPTLAQKKLLRAKGLAPGSWFVLKDTAGYMEVVSRAEAARVRMRKLEGVKVMPRTRILEKERT